MALKKTLSRILSQAIVVPLAADAPAVTFILPWHGGGHTPVSRSTPWSGAGTYQTPAQDSAVIWALAVRCRDGEIARVLSKRGSTTARGKRWPQPRVASTRKQYGMAAVAKATLAPTLLSRGQAVTYTGGSDPTLRKLLHKQLLPYAPLAIRKTALETAPGRSILDHLKETGGLALEGVSLGHQPSLCTEFQPRKKEGD